VQSERSLFQWIHGAGRICEKWCVLEVKMSRGWEKGCALEIGRENTVSAQHPCAFCIGSDCHTPLMGALSRAGTTAAVQARLPSGMGLT